MIDRNKNLWDLWIIVHDSIGNSNFTEQNTGVVDTDQVQKYQSCPLNLRCHSVHKVTTKNDFCLT